MPFLVRRDAIPLELAGEELGRDEIVRLLSARGSERERVFAAADRLRREVCGDEVTYVVTRNIQYTNVCYFKCGFCAFSKGKLAENLRGPAFLVPMDEIVRRSQEAWDRGATEVCLQGGIHPAFTGDYYAEVVASIREAVPGLHIHAFSALEVWQGAATLGLTLDEYLARLRDLGLGSLPGTAAEILDDEVRAIICPDKVSTDQWLEVHDAAHRVGLRSNVTMMMGHVDGPGNWANHLLRAREQQVRSGGFTEFVPLPFVPMEAPMFLKGRARRGPTFGETLLIHSVARLALHPLITNIQVSWVKIGPEGVRQALAAGVNDLGGTLMNESISRAAGSEWGQELPPEQMEAVIRSAGRVPRQRTTTYGTPPEEQVLRSFGAEPLAEPLNPPVRDAGLKRPARLVRPGLAGAKRVAATRGSAGAARAPDGFFRIRNGSDSGPPDGREPRAGERLAERDRRVRPVDALAVADEQVLRLVRAQPARRRQLQERVDADPVVADREERVRAERLGGDEHRGSGHQSAISCQRFARLISITSNGVPGSDSGTTR